MEKEIYVTRSAMPPFEEYVEMIKPLWETRHLTNMGKYHKELESKLCDYLDVDNVSLTVNGHIALELAIQAMEFPKGSEVITTPFTFISTTHAIIRNGLEPVFCDVKDDFTIDEERIEELITDKTVAIVPVHVYGNICNVKRIEEIAFKYNLKVIYDAAHAFGEKINGRSVASYGDASTFSFHATKVFNTIEGGAVCTANKELYEKLYNLKNFGIRSEEMVVSVGANAKMNEFQAAMGICNLKYVPEVIARRKKLVGLYDKYLDGIDGITVNKYADNVDSNYSYYPILLRDEELRDKVYRTLMENGIYSRKYFYPLTSDQMCFGDKYKNANIDNARQYSKRVLVLPLYPDMLETDISKVSKIIEDACTTY